MKPKDAVFVSVRGYEEAFRPGTEPKPVVVSSPLDVEGPKPYTEIWRDGLTEEAVPAAETPERKPYVDEAEPILY